LRGHGFKVFSTGIVDALKGLQETGLQDRDDFYNILRANLVAGDLEWKLFKDLFEEFWHSAKATEEKGCEDQEEEAPPSAEDLITAAPPRRVTEDKADLLAPDKKGSLEGTLLQPCCSFREERYFPIRERGHSGRSPHFKEHDRFLQSGGVQAVQATKKARDMDFRQILKRSLKVEGLPLDLSYRSGRKDSRSW